MTARMVTALALALVAGCGSETSASSADGEPRIVSIGGAITEIVFALGAGDQVVGVDSSSLYPPRATELPQIGSHHQISAEGVLALRPSLVVATSRAPEAALEHIAAAGVEVEIVDEVHTSAGAAERVRRVGEALGRDRAAAALAAELTGELDALAAEAEAAPDRPRVLFVYARGPNVLSVGGTATPADEMIRLAGGVNAAADLEGFRPLNAEAAVAAAPDVLLMMASGAASVNESGGAFALPGIALTPAGEHRRLVEMDGLLLLGLGPRMPEAVRELRVALAESMAAERGAP